MSTFHNTFLCHESNLYIKMNCFIWILIVQRLPSACTTTCFHCVRTGLHCLTLYFIVLLHVSIVYAGALYLGPHLASSQQILSLPTHPLTVFILVRLPIMLLIIYGYIVCIYPCHFLYTVDAMLYIGVM